jgi:hypothetical protein
MRKLLLAATTLALIATAADAQMKPGLTMYENCAAFHYIIHEKVQWDEATAQKSAALSELFIKIAAMERERIGDSAENTLPQISKQIDAFYITMQKNYDETGQLWGKDPFFVELLQACTDFVKTLENQ